MLIKVEKYHKYDMYENNKVKGVAKIAIMIDNHAFIVDGVKVIAKDTGAIFYALPSKEVIDDHGDKKYHQICGFFTKESYAAFHLAITKAFKEYFANEASEPPKQPVQQNNILEDVNVPF